MVSCEKYLDIVAAGEEASPAEREAARAHAAACPECARMAAAFASVEGALAARPEPAPADFASRLLARLPLVPKRKFSLRTALREFRLSPAAVGAGVAGAAAAALGAVVVRIASNDPDWFIETPQAFAAAATADASFAGTFLGAAVATVAVAGFFAYYYLLPTD